MGVYNTTIQVRLTRDEKAMLIRKMRDEGYHNLSVWVRKRLFDNALQMEQKVDEIYRYVLEQRSHDAGVEGD